MTVYLPHMQIIQIKSDGNIAKHKRPISSDCDFTKLNKATLFTRKFKDFFWVANLTSFTDRLTVSFVNG